MYGTAEGLNTFFAEQRVAAALDDSSDENIEKLLSAASATMDSFFQAHYNVPVDPSTLTDSTQQTQLTDWLEYFCYGTVASIVFSSSKDIPKATQKLLEHSRKTLEDIKKGVLAIPYMPTGQRITFSKVGDAENAITRNTFQVSRQWQMLG